MNTTILNMSDVMEKVNEVSERLSTQEWCDRWNVSDTKGRVKMHRELRQQMADEVNEHFGVTVIAKWKE